MGSSMTEIVGAVATVTTFGLFLSGSFTARKVWRMGTPGDLSVVPFIAGALGCTLWFLYGVYLVDKTIIYTNIVGITTNCLYVGVFLWFATRRVEMTRQIFLVIIFLTGVIVHINLITENESAKDRLGLICTVVSVLNCASPLATLSHVLRTKSTETLPFPLILAIFVVCFEWWVYGILINDFYMEVTNALGTIIGLAQLSLFLIYPSNSSKAGALLVNDQKGNYQKISSKVPVI